ncbi:MAG: cytochrome B [Proteobacteria bacterium]|nr:cytochrome B [Pseudomonadota bacterium]
MARREILRAHPWPVRLAHWATVLAVGIMLASGWRIYDAAPFYAWWHFPPQFTLGGWLAGALMWHFAAMWLLVGSGLVYVGYNILSGRFVRQFWPLSVGGLLRDVGDVLRLRLGHADLNRYNTIQKLMYLGVVAALVVIVASGLVVWKPVQFPFLRMVMGDYGGARQVHFWAMAAIVAFVLVHVVMVVLVPNSLRTMTNVGVKK